MLKLLISILTLSFCSSLLADLMISPTRVVLGDRNRSAKVTLINSSNLSRSYRIEWTQKVALPNGSYRELTENEKQQYSGLERIVRISPKQVTIPAGQSQSIKLLLRKKGKLSEGEYRSHLKFVALPVQKAPAAQGQMSLNINLLLSYSIPVMYRNGTVSVQPAIQNVSITTKKETGQTFVKVRLAHKDKYSATGRLVAYWTPKNGARRKVGLLNGFNFYPETPVTNAELYWKDFKLEAGILEVRYEGQQEFAGRLLASRSIEITDAIVRNAARQ